MKNYVLTALAATTAIAGISAGAAFAQEGATQRAERPAMTRDAVEQRADRAFARLDINSDGMISEADREARQRQAFDRMDADGSGSIEFSEFAERRANAREMRSEARENGERQARRGRAGMRGPGLGRGAMAAADSDGDGAISQPEFTAALLARFDAVDANGDGEITRDERRGQRMERRGQRLRRGA